MFTTLKITVVFKKIGDKLPQLSYCPEPFETALYDILCFDECQTHQCQYFQGKVVSLGHPVIYEKLCT